MTRVIVIDDQADLVRLLVRVFKAEGFEVKGFDKPTDGLAEAMANPPDLIVCDVTMPGMTGHELLVELRKHEPTRLVPFIFLSARTERHEISKGMTGGAEDYITKPFELDDLLGRVRARLDRFVELRVPTPAPAVPRTSKPQDKRRPKSRPPELPPIVESPALKAVYKEALLFAKADLTMLILGETGSGKDVLALAIHKASSRANGIFLPVVGANLSPTLVESELFGHEKNAFTGAGPMKMGVFEAANGGTIFLDEVGDLPRPMQTKLLQVLENRQIMRVGGREQIDVDVRVIAATNKDLPALIDQGEFREDLYWRLNGGTVTLPPLRQRVEDIAPLAERFLDVLGKRQGRQGMSLAPEALSALQRWSWKGNVRELRHAIQRAIALADGQVIGLQDLQDKFVNGAPSAAVSNDESSERDRMVEALAQCGGNQGRAAKVMGWSRGKFIQRMKLHDIKRPSDR